MFKMSSVAELDCDFMGANSHFKRLMFGRFFVYDHTVRYKDDSGLSVGSSHIYDVYDPFDDHWFGSFPDFNSAVAFVRNKYDRLGKELIFHD